MYPYNNQQQSNYGMNQSPPYGATPYPSNPSMAMPAPDFSVNIGYQDAYPQNSGYPMNATPYPQYPPNNNYQQPPNGNYYPNNNSYQAPVPPTASNYNPQTTQSNIYPNLLPNMYNGTQITGQSYANPSPPMANYNIPQTYYEGTVKPNPSMNAIDDAARLYKAMKGFGTDETTLIDIICRRTNQERQRIASAFKTAYGKDLTRDVKSETSGNFCSLLVGLLTPRIEYEAHEIRNAIAGAGTDEIALIDVICTKTNSEMMQLRAVYRQLFHREIESDVKSDVSGYFRRILVSLINANRSEAPADPNRAKQLARELYEAGEKRLGTDEVKFNQIFACESLSQLKMVFEEYYKQTGHDIEKAIKSEMSGDVKDAFLAIAQIAKYPPAYFAERLYKSMKGLGTLDNTLIRNMVLRSEIDMREIKVEFQKRYSKTLESFIKGDTSGDYKRALLALAGDVNWK